MWLNTHFMNYWTHMECLLWIISNWWIYKERKISLDSTKLTEMTPYQHACLGNMAAAVQHPSLGTLRKHVTKPFPQPAAPDCKWTDCPCHKSNWLKMRICTALERKACPGFKEAGLKLQSMADWLYIGCWPHWAYKFQKRASLFDQCCTLGIDTAVATMWGVPSFF